MSFGRRGSRTPSSPQPIYIVSSGCDVEQVFAHLEDAERFAREYSDARISHHHVRQSVDEAVVIFDRRVVVAQGATVLDRTNVVRRFIDDPLDSPGPADVEWFHDDPGWHISGFGIDKAALDAKIQAVIDRICQLGHGSPREVSSS